MKPKQMLITAFLSFSLAFCPLLGFAADQKDIEKITDKVMEQGKTYEMNPVEKFKGIKKTENEKIDEKTNREISFFAYYRESNGRKYVCGAILILEDLKQMDNGNYEMQQTTIADDACDGIVDNYFWTRFIKDEEGRVKVLDPTQYETKKYNLKDPTVRKEAQDTYDRYVKEMLDYVTKK